MIDRNIDDIVKRVVSEVQALQNTNLAREKIRTAKLKTPEHYEIEESAVPSVADNEALVKVEGCLLSFSDTVEFLKESNNGHTSSFGNFGTGVVLKVGRNVVDAFGNPLKTGDKVVGIEKKNGLVDQNSKTWYSNYIVCKANYNLFKVNSLDLDSRLIMKKVLDVYGEIKRLSKMGKGKESSVVVFGSKLEALLVTAILKAMDFEKIIVVGANEEELRLAKILGAKETVISSEKRGIVGIQETIFRDLGDRKADMVLLCTSKVISRTIAKRFAISEGCIYDLSYLINDRNEKIHKYEDSYGTHKTSFTEEEYKDCLAILETASRKKLPLYRLISHRFSLDQIDEAHWAGIREEGMLIGIFNR